MIGEVRVTIREGQLSTAQPSCRARQGQLKPHERYHDHHQHEEQQHRKLYRSMLAGDRVGEAIIAALRGGKGQDVGGDRESAQAGVPRRGSPRLREGRRGCRFRHVRERMRERGREGVRERARDRDREGSPRKQSTPRSSPEYVCTVERSLGPLDRRLPAFLSNRGSTW